jgi:hypothetical protein
MANHSQGRSESSGRSSSKPGQQDHTKQPTSPGSTHPESSPAPLFESPSQDGFFGSGLNEEEDALGSSAAQSKVAAPSRSGAETQQRQYDQSVHDFSLSSLVVDREDGTTALQVSIDQTPLIAQDFTTILSALTRLHAKGWLLQQGRAADVSRYEQTKDSRFVEEASLTIISLSHQSPALITLLTDPALITGVVTSTVTLAVALQKVIDLVEKVWRKHQDEKLAKRMQQRNFALEAAKVYVNTVCSSCDQVTKDKMIQAVVPDISELLLLKRKRR